MCRSPRVRGRTPQHHRGRAARVPSGKIEGVRETRENRDQKNACGKRYKVEAEESNRDGRVKDQADRYLLQGWSTEGVASSQRKQDRENRHEADRRQPRVSQNNSKQELHKEVDESSARKVILLQ
jgi:hypothetical protein